VRAFIIHPRAARDYSSVIAALHYVRAVRQRVARLNERILYAVLPRCVPQVMQKSCRCGFMYGELTDKETIARIEECLEGQIHDQFEILLYKKTSK